MTSVYGLVCALDTVPTVEPREGPGLPSPAAGARGALGSRASPLPGWEGGLRTASNPSAWKDCLLLSLWSIRRGRKCLWIQTVGTGSKVDFCQEKMREMSLPICLTSA